MAKDKERITTKTKENPVKSAGGIRGWGTSEMLILDLKITADIMWPTQRVLGF